MSKESRVISYFIWVNLSVRDMISVYILPKSKIPEILLCTKIYIVSVAMTKAGSFLILKVRGSWSVLCKGPDFIKAGSI